MEYSHGLSDAVLWADSGCAKPEELRPLNRVLKPDELLPDMLLGAALLVLCVVFFVFWFGARLSRASKGNLRGK